MILTETDFVQRERETAAIHPEPIDEFCLREGDFVAVVEPHENQYRFYVRDLRRERPTIHGFNVDFSKAVSTVVQLLDALASEK